MSNWTRRGDHVFIVLPRGTPILAGVLEAAQEAEVVSGAVFGIGAVESLRLAWFDRWESTYRECSLDGVWEIASLTGNLTRFDDGLRFHCHMVASDRSCNPRAGHLVAGVVAVTCELAVFPYESPLVRKMDPAFALPLIDLSE